MKLIFNFAKIAACQSNVKDNYISKYNYCVHNYNVYSTRQCNKFKMLGANTVFLHQTTAVYNFLLILNSIVATILKVKHLFVVSLAFNCVYFTIVLVNMFIFYLNSDLLSPANFIWDYENSVCAEDGFYVKIVKFSTFEETNNSLFCKYKDFIENIKASGDGDLFLLFFNDNYKKIARFKCFFYLFMYLLISFFIFCYGLVVLIVFFWRDNFFFQLKLTKIKV